MKTFGKTRIDYFGSSDIFNRSGKLKSIGTTQFDYSHLPDRKGRLCAQNRFVKYYHISFQVMERILIP